MKSNNIILTVLLALFVGLLITLMVGLITYTPTTTDTACCSITVERLENNTAIVHYISSDAQESYEIYVEVEYPNPYLTNKQELQELILEQVMRMQEDCYHNH